MGERLSGKTALISAAGQGIGRATALAFAAEGARVIATDINAETLEGLAAEADVETRLLDVRDRGAVGAAAAELGALDVLFNCAGWVAHGTLLECTAEDWDRSFDLNVRAMYLMNAAFLPAMLGAGGSSIINMASIASSVRGVRQRCAYAASKAAVVGLTKSIAIDYVTQGIRCNALCPGTVQTPSLDERVKVFADAGTPREVFIARQPMGRLGTPEEIAALCVYLASDESAFMTGATLTIDGGMAV
jgi:2-keto-3-deoxy-L-fuconate dehydrogenase